MCEKIDHFPPWQSGQTEDCLPILQSREIKSQQNSPLINSGGNNWPSQKALDKHDFYFSKSLLVYDLKKENDIYSRSVRLYKERKEYSKNLNLCLFYLHK